MRKFSLLILLVVFAMPTGLVWAHGDVEVPCTGVLILDAYARPTVTQTDAAYGIFINLGEEDLTLIGGETAIAEAVEIHEMTMTDGVMSMNPLSDGLLVPHLSAVALEPGGFHVMFIGVTEEVMVDSTLAFSLTVEGLEEAIALEVPVIELEGMAMGEHGGDAMGDPAATEAAMSDPTATEEAMHGEGDDHAMESLIMPMGGLNIGLGDCAELDLEIVSWSVKAHDEGLELHLILGDEEYKLPIVSLVHGMVGEME
jgi:hypothetical protein